MKSCCPRTSLFERMLHKKPRIHRGKGRAALVSKMRRKLLLPTLHKQTAVIGARSRAHVSQYLGLHGRSSFPPLVSSTSALRGAERKPPAPSLISSMFIHIISDATGKFPGQREPRANKGASHMMELWLVEGIVVKSVNAAAPNCVPRAVKRSPSSICTGFGVKTLTFWLGLRW